MGSLHTPQQLTPTGDTVNAPTPPTDDSYQVSSDYAWTKAAYEELTEGSQLRGEVISRDGVMASHVWGQCPRCRHFLDDRQTLTALTSLMGVRGTGSGQPVGDAGARFAQVDVSCGCRDTHSGAPAGTTGCGTSFRVELPVRETGSGTHS
jgi:hypothetical protein